MRSRTLIAMPIAAAVTLGGAGLALAGDDPKPAKRPAVMNAITEPVEMPPPMFAGGPGEIGPIGPFGYDKEFAEELAAQLGIEESKVVAGVRKVLENRFNKRRDEALKCFDDPKECKIANEKMALSMRPKLVRPRALRRP
jgi:hypothetical protein